MKPFVVLAGPIHADGIKLLESEARVLVSSEETEAGMLKVAQEAEGILFRAKPAWKEIAQGILFKKGDIVEHGEEAEEEAD